MWLLGLFWVVWKGWLGSEWGVLRKAPFHTLLWLIVSLDP